MLPTTGVRLAGYLLLSLVGTLAFGQGSLAAQPLGHESSGGKSPAQCGEGDIPEPGIQGDVPPGDEPNYHCGIKLVGQLPLVGSVQGFGQCAYLRVGGRSGGDSGGVVHVLDVSNPAAPLEVGRVPVKSASETMRTMVTDERAILVSGSSIYDISNCLEPVLLGDIEWPPLAIGVNPPSGGGGGSGLLPHDLRINHSATKVYASMGLWEVDISNLDDPGSWTVTDYRCDLAPQVPGPWQELHRQGQASGINLCDEAADPDGANYSNGGSRFQAALLWPTLSHSLDISGDGNRVYLGDQKLVGKMNIGEPPKMRIVDVTSRPVKIVGVTDGPGHSLDWFHTKGRDYVLHANEWGSSQKQPYGPSGDTCQPHPRPSALGWAFDVIVSDVTNDQARNVSTLKIAINEPQFCEARKASGRDPSVAYHLVDDAMNATFAAVNFGDAGLRIFDIRDPREPTEIAYFNHGPLVHGGIGHYDAERGLIYAAGESGFWVLELEPQVRARLGL